MPYLKQETGTVQRRHDVESPSPLRRSPASAEQGREGGGDVAKPQLLPLLASSPPPQQSERLEDVGKDEEEAGPIKMEVSSYSCEASYPPPPPLTEAEPNPEVIRAPEGYLSWTAADCQTRESALMSQEQTSTSGCAENRPDAALSFLAPREIASESPVPSPPILISMASGPEDPMAGMLALLTASEMARARPCTPAPTPATQMEKSPPSLDCSSTGALEMVALEGMALLSQVAQQEVEPLSPDQGGSSQMMMMVLISPDCVINSRSCCNSLCFLSRRCIKRSGLSSRSKQTDFVRGHREPVARRSAQNTRPEQEVQLEAEEGRAGTARTNGHRSDLKSCLFRKRDSSLWCLQLFSKMSLDVLDAVEVEYRVHLAELQKTYKEKQRDLSKLQRRRDKR